MDDNELTIRARDLARNLSYNGPGVEPAVKHTLHELAHRIDTKNIRVHKKRDGLLLINGLGQTRYMTVLERLRYRFFKLLPSRI